MHVQLFTVCTEFKLSVHQADCERATQPYSSGGGGTIFPGSRPAECYHSVVFTFCVVTHVRVGNRVFSHSLDIVSKTHIHIIYEGCPKSSWTRLDFLVS